MFQIRENYFWYNMVTCKFGITPAQAFQVDPILSSTEDGFGVTLRRRVVFHTLLLSRKLETGWYLQTNLEPRNLHHCKHLCHLLGACYSQLLPNLWPKTHGASSISQSMSFSFHFSKCIYHGQSSRWETIIFHYLEPST